MQYFGIVVAAGTGSRFGSDIPKQYHVIQDKTVLEHGIESLLALEHLAKLVVVLHPDDHHWTTLAIHRHPKIITTLGGLKRSDSSLNGVRALAKWADAQDWVLIHDAARPFVPLTDLTRLVNETRDHSIGGILAGRIVDTVKYSTDGQIITKTVPRNELYRALTPQCFRYGKLLDALEQVYTQKLDISDDSAALELQGYKPLLVLTEALVKKITYPEDL